MILSVIIWKSSHDLDPFKPLDSTKEPLTVQVVALQWKWLFIYPEQDIATVNTLRIPENTPINFQITADAPMNSFWIPSLGGQIYAMPGMMTKLHLDGTVQGVYEGSSANISGEGFSSMRFKTHVDSLETFNHWVDQTVKREGKDLTTEVYDELAEPSRDVLPIYYKSRDPSLYDKIIMKYMTPGAQSEGNHEHSH
jgi:cytochrome o ubiquinol oxidase subunit II